MDVLVLAWDAVAGGGAGPRASGLATALARHGASVRLVTRLADGEDVTALRRVEIHAVPDVAPVVPDELGSRPLRARGFGASALAVATRRLTERPVDLTVAVGADAHEVAMRLPGLSGAVVLDPDVCGPIDWPALGALAARGRAAGRRVIVAAPAREAREEASAAVGERVLVLPAAAPAPRVRPGRPPPTGPVRLVVGPGTSHDRAARRLRTVLDRTRTRRVITGRTRYRPAVVVVLDPDDGAAVLVGAASGVPVVARSGTAGRQVVALGCGVVVEDEQEAASACAALLGDADRAARLGDDGLAASERARREAVGALARLAGRGAPGTRPSGEPSNRGTGTGQNGEDGVPPLLRPV